MAPLRRRDRPMASSRVYVIATRDGSVRTLVDPNITRAMPHLRRALGTIGEILQNCLVDQDLVLSVTVEPAREELRSRATGMPRSPWRLAPFSAPPA